MLKTLQEAEDSSRNKYGFPPVGQIRNALDGLEPILLTEIKPANHSPEVYERLVGEGIKSIWLIPLVSRGCLLGFYGLGRRGEESFSDDDSEFLVRIGSQIAKSPLLWKMH
jgi:GAF domain-containing protein